jgi:hypothetical protein
MAAIFLIIPVVVVVVVVVVREWTRVDASRQLTN